MKQIAIADEIRQSITIWAIPDELKEELVDDMLKVNWHPTKGILKWEERFLSEGCVIVSKVFVDVILIL